MLMHPVSLPSLDYEIVSTCRNGRWDGAFKELPVTWHRSSRRRRHRSEGNPQREARYITWDLPQAVIFSPPYAKHARSKVISLGAAGTAPRFSIGLGQLKQRGS